MNTLTRRRFSLAGMTAVAAALGEAVAATSSRGVPGRIIVGYPVGGTLDQTARRVADAWRKQGRPVVVDNRAGAAGRIANSQLKRERGDGSALLCTHTSALTIYPHVYAKLMYDPAADFIPITPVVSATCAFAVSSAVPASVKSIADYVKWTAQTPAYASYASPAAGSMAHFLGFQLAQAAGLKLQHIGYRGSAPAMQDLLGGQIPAYLGFVADFLPYLRNGRLRILAVSGAERSRFMPAVPTFAEQGFETLTGIESYGLFAPPGTPDAIVRNIHEAVLAAVRDPGLVSGFEEVGLEPFTLPASDYAALITRERAAWGPVVRASGFRSEE